MPDQVSPSSDLLTRAQALLKGITPGEWRQDTLLVYMGKPRHVGHIHCTAWDGQRPVPEQAVKNAEFIAAAPQLVREFIERETWYPIASAPKDGRHLLLFDGERVSVGGWVSAADQGAEPYEEHLIAAGWWSIDLRDNDPTHWRPLPDPPSVEGSVLIEQKEEETDHARVDSTGRSAPNIDAGNSETVPPTVSDHQVSNELDAVMPNLWCGCCECQGKKCLIGHPGHSHRTPGYTPHQWRR